MGRRRVVRRRDTKRDTYTRCQSARRIWYISRSQWGKSGQVDFAKPAEKRVIENPFRWELSGSRRKADALGLDHPRVDIESFKSKTGRKVFVGSAKPWVRTSLVMLSKNVVNDNFSAEELKHMKAIYIEGSSPPVSNAAGACSTINAGKEKHYLIFVKPSSMNEFVLTHELVHARRYGFNEHVWDMNREEKMTELETVARVSPNGLTGWAGGYYQFHPEVAKLLREGKVKEAQKLIIELRKKDRELIMKGKKRMRGKTIRKRVKELYSESEISKAHFSPAEKLDRYFIIEKDGVKQRMHIRFEKPVSDKQVYADIKKAYNPTAVWEIKDGKKVRVI